MSFSCEMSNQNFNNQLFECSLLVVSLLLKQYKSKVIDITDFRSHITNKISYILSNFEVINVGIEKSTIESLLNECLEITNSH